jgi:group I intron endonuclease
MIGYIYKTTNLINNKIYIGQKYSNKFIKTYLGSGKIIKQAIKKYGKENFKVKILYKANSIKRLDEAEKVYIEIYNSTNTKIGYNISIGGHAPMLNRNHTKKAKLKISIGKRGVKLTENHKQKISISNIGKHNYWDGKHLSEEHKEKVSNSMKGKKNGLGSKHTEEWKKQQSERTKGNKNAKKNTNKPS